MAKATHLDLGLLFARATLLVFGWLARLCLFCGHVAEREASPVALESSHQVFSFGGRSGGIAEVDGRARVLRLSVASAIASRPAQVTATLKERRR
jgi:hypothetical protein